MAICGEQKYKGWMQTSAVHLTAPRLGVRELGLFPFLCSLATSLGVVLSTLFGPLFTILALGEIASGSPGAASGPIDVAVWTFALALLATGLASMVIPAFAAA